jgi:hypothetical protein
VNPFFQIVTGYSWLWTGSLGASSDFVSMLAMSTVSPSVACSTPPSHPEVPENTSALITTRSSNITNGRQT